MLGYWNDETKTREAIDAGGWMHTGDLAVIDDEGYCNIVGRIKDMVIRGGENIYPREIEEFLYAHPKVLDVQVVGIPDQKFGEELCAWIIVREGERLSEDEVRAYCRGRSRITRFRATSLRRQLPDDRDQQDPEVPDPPEDEGRAGAGRGADRLTSRTHP
ncbi:AMP-binding enzyme [Thauera humireducens]|uniref:AMP-binding enzyme n=1 Tax=Thauera humireducens TaxID=1134435 RepID=UPI003C7552BF